MTEANNRLLQRAAMSPRPRLAPRSLEEIYKLPSHAIITPEEACAVAQLTKSALAVRRTKGEWPPYLKFGRLVRYQLGVLIAPPNEGVAP
jgi:hypothetical protein